MQVHIASRWYWLFPGVGGWVMMAKDNFRLICNALSFYRQNVFMYFLSNEIIQFIIGDFRAKHKCVCGGGICIDIHRSFPKNRNLQCHWQNFKCMNSQQLENNP